MKQLEDTARRLIDRIQQADEKLTTSNIPQWENSFQEVKRQVRTMDKQCQKRQFILWSFSAAAIGLLTLLFSWFGQFEEPISLEAQNQLHQIVVPYGKHASITLADGTRMQINSGSTVVYSDNMNTSQREIAVDGEVYLEVAKMKDCPFVVKTKDFQVKVLGTTFNVSAYQDEPSASVVLVNGSVEIEAHHQKKILSPNQLAAIQKEGISIEEVDTYEYTCWKDKLLLLRDKPLGDVWKKLERYYNCHIQSTNKVDEIRLSGKLDLQENIEDVMDILSTSANLTYTLDTYNHVHVTLKK